MLLPPRRRPHRLGLSDLLTRLVTGLRDLLTRLVTGLRDLLMRLVTGLSDLLTRLAMLCARCHMERPLYLVPLACRTTGYLLAYGLMITLLLLLLLL